MPDEVTSVTEEMDMSQWLPPLDGIQDGLLTWMRVLVMVAPVIMFLLGLYYVFLSPKEANYSVGYRFYYAMSRVKVWRFAQRVAGIAYGSLGLILGVVMLCLSWDFSTMNPPDLVWYAVRCILWQIILVFVATVVVNVIIIVFYDRKGNLRSVKRKKKKERKARLENKEPKPKK